MGLLVVFSCILQVTVSESVHRADSHSGQRAKWARYTRATGQDIRSKIVSGRHGARCDCTTSGVQTFIFVLLLTDLLIYQGTCDPVDRHAEQSAQPD